MTSSEAILDLPPPPYQMRLTYGTDPNQFVDLRFPKGTGPFPAIFAIHGGFWRSKYDLTYLGHLCQALTDLGYLTANIEYRRVGNEGGGWPGTFRDVGDAAEQLLVNARNLRIDPARVAAVGHSAGGHLAFWLGGRHRVAGISPISGKTPQLIGVVSLGGVLDLEVCDRRRMGDDAVRELIDGDFQEYPDRFADASPASLLPLGVRQLVIHGIEDEDVPVEMARDYIDQAKAKGDPVEAIIMPNTGHFEVVDPESLQWPGVAGAIEGLFEQNNRIGKRVPEDG